MSILLHKALFEASLSHEIFNENTISKKEAESLFLFFKEHPLFKWKDANNNCENRANAICILLDQWNITSYKGWVFSGKFLKNENGNLINFWKFHVATLLLVKEGLQSKFYILDPSTSDKLETIQDWSNNITNIEYNYYFITPGDVYIFHPAKIKKDNWFKRNSQNYKWTIQGLAGINGVSRVGKAQLCFCKKKIEKTHRSFKELFHEKPKGLPVFTFGNK